MYDVNDHTPECRTWGWPLPALAVLDPDTCKLCLATRTAHARGKAEAHD